jgi:Ala-tRNA(Pro) deacylase
MDGLIGLHPNDNTATIWMKATDLVKLLEEDGHTVRTIAL